MSPRWQPHETSTPDYVLLTGGRNNAGDYYIGYRATQLLDELRPDRTYVEMNAWERLSDKQLDIINRSRALLLTGGPSVRPTMVPGIYPLRANLDEITVPIVLYGVGWKSATGHWSDTRRIQFTPESLALLEKCNQSGRAHSTRDYETQHTLLCHGVNRVWMTGCPGLYNGNQAQALPHKEAVLMDDERTVAFSTGVSFTRSDAAMVLHQQLMEGLAKGFPKASLTAVFHHTLDEARYRESYGELTLFFERQQQLAQWCRHQGIAVVDISGGVEAMLSQYQATDVHVGFRVHAHIYMSSLGKPSVLLAEDGRATALSKVLGGMVMNPYQPTPASPKPKRNLIQKLTGQRPKPVIEDSLTVVPHTVEDLMLQLHSQLSMPDQATSRLALPRHTVAAHYRTMQQFLAQLP